MTANNTISKAYEGLPFRLTAGEPPTTREAFQRSIDAAFAAGRASVPLYSPVPPTETKISKTEKDAHKVFLYRDSSQDVMPGDMPCNYWPICIDSFSPDSVPVFKELFMSSQALSAWNNDGRIREKFRPCLTRSVETLGQQPNVWEVTRRDGGIVGWRLNAVEGPFFEPAASQSEKTSLVSPPKMETKEEGLTIVFYYRSYSDAIPVWLNSQKVELSRRCYVDLEHLPSLVSLKEGLIHEMIFTLGAWEHWNSDPHVRSYVYKQIGTHTEIRRATLLTTYEGGAVTKATSLDLAQIFSTNV